METLVRGFDFGPFFIYTHRDRTCGCWASGTLFFERRCLMLAVESFKQTPVQNMTITKSRITGNAIGMLLNSENQKETSRGVSLFFQEIAMIKKMETLKQNIETETI